jgi:hypothetical protein
MKDLLLGHKFIEVELQVHGFIEIEELVVLGIAEAIVKLNQ